MLYDLSLYHISHALPQEFSSYCCQT